MNALMTFYWRICGYECIVNDDRNVERLLLTFSMPKYVSYNIIRSAYLTKRMEETRNPTAKNGASMKATVLCRCHYLCPKFGAR